MERADQNLVDSNAPMDTQILLVKAHMIPLDNSILHHKGRLLELDQVDCSNIQVYMADNPLHQSCHNQENMCHSNMV